MNIRGARDVMVSIVGNGQATRVQTLNDFDWISQNTYRLGMGMNPLILLPNMVKWQGKLDSSALVRQPV